MDNDNSPAVPATSQAPTPPPAPPENTIRVEGILDIDNSRNGQLLDLAKFGKRRPTDPFVPRELIRRFHLNQGSTITGRKSTRLNSSHPSKSRMPSSA